ncbi:ferrous iron transport protein A [Streptomyces sp. NPDC097619]|uniref:ferrous iron transport protein A n=1 Tax=Streptomyces sp. NPDC097619 TaxID=3157228 RepID=UPI0033341B10
MPSLLDHRPGTTVRLTAPGPEAPGRRRLLEYGFVPGVQVTVIARGATGGLLVGLGEARVALDSRTATGLRCER